MKFFDHLLRRKKKTIEEILIEDHKWCLEHGCANTDPEYCQWLIQKEEELRHKKEAKP